MKRITYVPRVEESDYVDARYDVLLDGEKVAEVTRNVENVGHGSATQTYYSYVTATTLWEVEGTYPNGRRYQQYTQSRTRMDAVIAYLTSARGMDYGAAREAVGKRGI